MYPKSKDTSNTEHKANGVIEFSGDDYGVWEHGFTQVPNTFLERTDLRPGTKLCMVMLLKYKWGNNRVFPGQERLAREMNCSVDSVCRYLQELRQFGFIRVTRRGHGRTNFYEIDVNALGTLIPQNPKSSGKTPEISDSRLRKFRIHDSANFGSNKTKVNNTNVEVNEGENPAHTHEPAHTDADAPEPELEPLPPIQYAKPFTSHEWKTAGPLWDEFIAATGHGRPYYNGAPGLRVQRILFHTPGIKTGDIAGVVQWMRSDPFYQKPDTLKVERIVSAIPEWVRQGRPERMSGSRHDEHVANIAKRRQELEDMVSTTPNGSESDRDVIEAAWEDATGERD